MNDSPAQRKGGWQQWEQGVGLHPIHIYWSHNFPNEPLQRETERRENVWDSSNCLWSTSALEVFMAALRAEFISQSQPTAHNTATGFDPWPLKAPLAAEIKSPTSGLMSKIDLAWWVDGQKATGQGSNHTIGKRHWFNCFANPPVEQSRNFFCYCFITLIVRKSPPVHTLNPFFRPIQVSSPCGY